MTDTNLADEEVNKIIRLANSIKYHCMNIMISVELNKLKKKGVISSFRVPDEYTIQYSADLTDIR